MGYALLGENLPEAWDQSVPCFTQEGDEKTGAIYQKFRRNLACHRAAWSLEPHEQSRAASPSDISQRDWRSVEGRDFPTRSSVRSRCVHLEVGNFPFPFRQRH